ncbi:MAG: hypothetical protein WBH28_13950 [Fuerstiella sp.]
MKRTVFHLSMTVTCCLVGCTQSLLSSSSLFSKTAMEQRVVEQFTDALDEDNESALRRITSSRFEAKALRSEDVLSDLRVLHLPSGKLTVVEVKDEGEDRKEVIVKEESGGKYQFHLVHDPVKSYWVVDDVMVRQRNNGTRITKSTTEVMDLLVTLRQFLKVWESGSREEILAMTSTDLTKSLSPLPDDWLKALTARIASSYEDGMARKPEANLDEEVAVVKLPSRNGHILLKISRESGEWLVDDVESINRREENRPGSVRRQADAINAVNGFLTAYLAEDHESLAKITDPVFYSSSLKLADLSLVKLPRPADVPAEFDIRAYEGQLTFMIPSGTEIIRLDLVENPDAVVPMVVVGVDTPEKNLSRFSVKEVTLYERSTQRQRTLSSVFTAPTRASLFLKALQQQDVSMLSQISTTEFSSGLWDRVSPEILTELSIPDFYGTGLTLQDSHSIAERTEIEFVTASGLLVSCKMLNQNGTLKVDDVQFPNQDGHVTSLRTRLELTLPIMEFAQAWSEKDLELLQKSCSSDFNRLVWGHLDAIPERFSLVAGQLRQPVLDTRITQERATVRLGRNAESAMTASLVMEHGFWVVDEVRVAVRPGELVGVREKLRGEISEKLLSGSYSTRHSLNGHDVIVPIATPQSADSLFSASDRVQQVSADSSSAEYNKAVQHAVYTREENLDGTMPTGTAVTPAVRTNVFSDGQMAGNMNSGNGAVSTAGFERPLASQKSPSGSVHSATGIQVFGPQAGDVVRTLDEAAGSEIGRQSSAIDMTPETAPVVKDSFMYFGPDKAKLENPAPVSQTEMPRRLTQPADMPIPID